MISNSMDAADGCMLCRPEVADAFFTRMLLWQDERWRLSAVLQGPTAIGVVMGATKRAMSADRRERASEPGNRPLS